MRLTRAQLLVKPLQQLCRRRRAVAATLRSQLSDKPSRRRAYLAPVVNELDQLWRAASTRKRASERTASGEARDAAQA